MSASVMAPRNDGHGREGELAEELALASGEQQFRDTGRGEDLDVPGTAVGDVGQRLEPEAGEAHLDRGEAQYVPRMGAGEAVDRHAADVLAGEVDRADIENLDQLVEIFGRGHAVVLARSVARVAEAAQVDG